ncbi:branched-chain amino acid ABC transporter permease [Variovorax sp. YR216]|uniref:branched-chain amino acid ABC transporter permease n=1 Tax=Variovorax sp. YR216 TaxID=1882828 RepID=UPI000895313F|nr:branched-chain amino acid ABC transporter permease [Variovorax sp. YR216]SEB25981.1 amino acid/amide ABC transporter membrane protein 1, HAAT family [Variovorax sp. YR216]
MASELLQFLFSGLTVGAMYALAALGYALIYNASHIVNFAQGEFIMLGAMTASALTEAGIGLPMAIALAIVVSVVAGMGMERLAIRPARGAPLVTLLIVTLGVALVIRGAVQVALGKGNHTLAAFSGDAPIRVGGATLVPQSLWVFGVTLLVVMALAWYFGRTVSGKAMLATSHNRLAAELVGVSTNRVLLASFALSGALGAIGGVITAPITFTSYDAGVVLGLKGFAAAALGGIGSGPGAIAGGLALGVMEAMAAGYVSAAYKDAVAFVLILLVLMFMPRGLFGARVTERV